MKVGEMVEVGKLPVGAIFRTHIDGSACRSERVAAGVRDLNCSHISLVSGVVEDVRVFERPRLLLSLPSEDKPSFPRKPKSFEEIRVGMRVRVRTGVGLNGVVGGLHANFGQVCFRLTPHPAIDNGVRIEGLPRCEEHGTAGFSSWTNLALSDPSSGVPARQPETDLCCVNGGGCGRAGSVKMRYRRTGEIQPFCREHAPTFEVGDAWHRVAAEAPADSSRATASPVADPRPSEAPYALQPRTEAQESVSRVLASWSGLEDFPELPTEDDVEHSRWQRRTDHFAKLDAESGAHRVHENDTWSCGANNLGPLDQRIAACGGSLDPKPERMTLRSKQRGLQP